MSGSSKRKKKKSKGRTESLEECNLVDRSRTNKAYLIEPCPSDIHKDSSCSVDGLPTEPHHSSCNNQAVQDSKLTVHSLTDSDTVKCSIDNDNEAGGINGHSEAVCETLSASGGTSVNVKDTDKSKRKKKHKKLKNSIEVTPNREDTAEPHANGSAPSSFEAELAWCINQLHLGMASSHGDKHQKQTYEKNIKTLSSLKTPLPRKRQLMRSMFGDYRGKMKTHPVPESLLQTKQRGITSVKSNNTGFEPKYMYYKPSASTCLATTSKETQTKDITGNGDWRSKTNVETGSSMSMNEFRFNFEIGPELLT